MGLFNGARGTAIKIAYTKGKTPNNGDMPEYIIVDFPHFSGPAYFASHPTASCCVCINVVFNLVFFMCISVVFCLFYSGCSSLPPPYLARRCAVSYGLYLWLWYRPQQFTRLREQKQARLSLQDHPILATRSLWILARCILKRPVQGLPMWQWQGLTHWARATL